MNITELQLRDLNRRVERLEEENGRIREKNIQLDAACQWLGERMIDVLILTKRGFDLTHEAQEAAKT